MGRDDKIRMPSSMGGLTSYAEDYKSNIEIKPGTVIMIIILVAITLILLNIYGRTLFGI